MRTRACLVLTTAALSAIVFAACGDDDETNAAVTTTTETTETTAIERPDTFDVYLLPAEIGDDCSVVIPSEREARGEEEVADALTQLLAGPTAEEEAQELDSWFSEETEGMLNRVVIEDGAAEVDFADFSGIIPNASTSCGSASLLAQLDNTVLQFPGLDDVAYSFDDDRAAFYEWLQLGPPE